MNLSRLLNQTLVYWVAGGDDRHGNPSWSTGVNLTCRWQERAELFVNENGEEEMASAVVYLDGADTVALDGRMYLGDVADLASSADPVSVQAYRVASIQSTPSIDAAQSLQKVLLK